MLCTWPISKLRADLLREFFLNSNLNIIASITFTTIQISCKYLFQLQAHFWLFSQEIPAKLNGTKLHLKMETNSPCHFEANSLVGHAHKANLYPFKLFLFSFAFCSLIFSFLLLCYFNRPFSCLCFSRKRQGIWSLSLIRDENFVRFLCLSLL